MRMTADMTVLYVSPVCHSTSVFHNRTSKTTLYACKQIRYTTKDASLHNTPQARAVHIDMYNNFVESVVTLEEEDHAYQVLTRRT